MYVVVFEDKSRVSHTASFGFYYPMTEWDDKTQIANKVWGDVETIKATQKEYYFNNFRMSMPVDFNNPLFLKLFIMENYPTATFLGDTPDTAEYEKRINPLIVE